MDHKEDAKPKRFDSGYANHEYSKEHSRLDPQFKSGRDDSQGCDSNTEIVSSLTNVSDSLLLRGIILDAGNHFNVDIAYLVGISPKDTFRIVAHHGFSESEKLDYESLFLNIVEGQSYISRAPIIVADTSIDPRFLTFADKKPPGRSIMAFPVFSGNYILGIVGLQSFRKNKFTIESLKKINDFAARTARILERNLFERKCKVQDNKLDLLNKLARVISETVNLLDLRRNIEKILGEFLTLSEYSVVFFTSMKILDSLPKNVRKVILQKKPDYVEQDESGKRLVTPIYINENPAGYILVKGIAVDEYVDVIESIACLSGNAFRRIHLDREILSKGSEIQALETIAEYEMSSGLLSSSSLDDIFESTMEVVLKLLKVERMNIMLYDRQEEELKVVAWWGMDDIPLGREVLKLGEGVGGFALKSGKPYQVPVRGMDGVFVDSPPEQKEIKSILAYPLIVEGRKIGVINVGSVYHYRIFTEGEIKKLSLIASRAALAIENSKLMKERLNLLEELTDKNAALEKRTRELSDREEKMMSMTMQLRESLDRLEKTSSRLSELYDFSRAISRNLQLEMILETSLNRIQGILTGSVFQVKISILDPTFKYCLKDLSRNLETRLITPEKLKTELTPEIYGMIVDEKKVITPEIIESCRETEVAPGKGDYGNIYAFPLTTGEKNRGILILHSQQKDLLDQEDVQLLTNFTQNMAMAINNAVIFREIEERSERLNLLNRMHREMSISLDMDDLHDKIISFSCRLLKLQGACLYLYDNNNNLKLEAIKNNNSHRSFFEKDEIMKILEGIIKNQRVYFAVNDHDLIKRKFSAFKTIKAETIVVIPLYSKHRKIGVLLLFGHHRNSYLPQQMEFYQLFSSQIALIIDNAHLFSRIINDKERIESVFRSMKEGLVCIDRTHKITVFNKAAEEITGWKESDVIEKPCNSILCCTTEHHSGDCRRDCLLDKIINKEVDIKEENRFEGTFLTPEGEEKFLNGVISVLSMDGKPTGGVLVFRDITEEREYNKRRSDYLAGLSHDMFTPLTAIKGYTTTLLLHRERFDQDTQIRFVKIINSEIDRITRILYNLMSLSRMETKHLTTSIQPQILIYIVNKVVDIHSLNTDKHSIIVDESIKKSPPVMADSDHLEQILNNLISNAVKYSPAGGDIKIAAKKDGKLVQIMVEDQGIGIEEENLGKIFNRYERVSRKITNSISGMGLGLYITKALVEIQGGEIWAENNPEGGSRFVFTLKLAEL